jgi:type IV pilus assembly protein PilW
VSGGEDKKMKSLARSQRHATGFTLVELMVALALGMLLAVAMTYVYLNSRTAFSRQQQLSSIQQNVRIAFDYLSSDARMVGHMGCFTGSPMTSPPFYNDLVTTDIRTNFQLGIEGYEYTNPSANAYPIGSNTPNDITAAGNWATNAAPTTAAAVPITLIAGTGLGLTPGTDVLVIRTVAGRPVSLAATANSPAGQTTLSIETASGNSTFCRDGTTKKASGFCAGSHGLIASCTRARAFKVNSIVPGTALSTPSTLTLAASMGSDPQYTVGASEVFPMQTIVYFVKKSSSGTSTSLYRRIFDGASADCPTCDPALGLQQELIEGVENLQVRYGVDTTTPEPDGVVDAYVAANGVTDWSRVVAVRMGLLIRSTVPIEADLASALPASAPVNGVAVTYPTTGSKYDRRVFTTTVAVRNKIAYF